MDGWLLLLSSPIPSHKSPSLQSGLWSQCPTHTHTHTHTHVYINILSFPHFDSRKNLLATDAVAQIFQTQPIPFPYFFIIPKPPWGIYFSLPLANHPPGKKIKNKKALKFFIIVKTAEPYMYIYPFFCL